MRRITIIAAALATAALATTYIQTSSTGVAPWKPVKDSVSRALLADSALKADSSRAAWKADSARIAWFAHAATYADSSRASGLADSAKRSEWAPLDTVRVRGIVGDTAASLRIGMGAYIPLTGSDAIDGNLSSISGNSLGTLSHPWGYSFFRELAIDSLGDRRLYIEQNGSIDWGKGGSSGPSIYCDWSDIYRPLHFTNSPVDFDAYWVKAPQFIVRGGTVKGFLKADGSVDSSGVFSGVSDTAKKAGTATKLAAARTIGMSGDVTGTATAFDGTANITIPTTLPTLLTAGSAGSATSVPTLTWDAKGRLTAAGSAAISIPHAQISDWGTYINQPLLTTSSPTFGQASLGTWTPSSNVAWFGAVGQNNITNGISGFLQFANGDKSVFMSAPAGGFANIQYNSTGYIIVGSSGVSMPNPSGLAVTGPITANGGIAANSYSITALNAAPASASSTGTVGQILWTDGYVYLCVSTNTWKRAALTTW